MILYAFTYRRSPSGEWRCFDACTKTYAEEMRDVLTKAGHEAGPVTEVPSGELPPTGDSK